MNTQPLALVALRPLATLSASAATRYVSVKKPTPQYRHDTFPKAAANIQDAIYVAGSGDLILVPNGVDRTGGASVGGGYLRSRVPVWKPVTVRSINGPQVSIIEGQQVTGTTNDDGAIRCAYLVRGAVLGGFTLTNGATRGSVALLQHRRPGHLPGQRRYRSARAVQLPYLWNAGLGFMRFTSASDFGWQQGVASWKNNNKTETNSVSKRRR